MGIERLHIETYSVWKTIAALKPVVYERVITTDTRQVWVGDRDYLYAADVGPSDAADFVATFGTRTTVASEDEAKGLVLNYAPEARTIDGTPQVAVQPLTLGQSAFQRVDDGTEIMNIDGRAAGTPVNIWDGTGGSDSGASDWSTNGIGSETAGAMHAGTNGWDTGVSTATNQVTRFTDPGGDSDIAGTYSELRFWMRPKAFPVGARLRVDWQRGDNTAVGSSVNVAAYVTNFDLDVWQQVAIPISDFGITEDVSKVRFLYRNVAGQHFHFDEIALVPVGSGPFRFRVAAPDSSTRYHVSMVVLVVTGAASGWDESKFANIAALPLGLVLRQRRLSDSEVIWRLNSKDNVDLFGRFHPQDDIEFADGSLLVGFMVKPGKASVIVTDDDVIEFLVRDDLSGLDQCRAYVHYGVEVSP